MIIKIKNNPGFENLCEPDKYVFFRCVHNKCIYGYLAYAIAIDSAIVHFKFNDDFKLSTMKAALRDWELIKKMLASNNVKKISTINNLESGSIWDRFIKLFGFSEPVTMKISSMEV